jgi:exopolysaccharide production protein ExoQ
VDSDPSRRGEINQRISKNQNSNGVSQRIDTQKLLDWVFGLSAILVLPIAVFVPKGVIVLFVLTTLPLLVISIANNNKTWIPRGVGTLLAIAFAILAVTSMMWSKTPEASLNKALVFSLVIFGGLVLLSITSHLENVAGQPFENGLIVGGIVVFAVMGIEIVFGSPLFALLLQVDSSTINPSVLLGAMNQGAAVISIAMLLWTVALYRRKGAVWAGGGFVLGCIVLIFCDADSHKAALAIGITTALVSFFGGRTVISGSAYLLVVSVLTGPWLVKALPDPLEANNGAAFLPHSAQHRLVIWQTTVNHIFERPVLGSGFDTARAFYGPNEKVTFTFGGKGDHTKWVNRFEPIPLHPHNGVLQIWLELGALGAVMFAAGLFYIVHRLSHLDNRLERSMVFGSFITGLAIFSVSYGAWQSWWMGTIWLMMAYGAASCRKRTA